MTEYFNALLAVGGALVSGVAIGLMASIAVGVVMFGLAWVFKKAGFGTYESNLEKIYTWSLIGFLVFVLLVVAPLAMMKP